MNSGMIILNESIETKQNYATWIETTSLFILKLKLFIKILEMILKKDLIHQIMKSTDHYLQEKIKKVIELMKDELRGKIMGQFAVLRSKIYSSLMDDGNSDEKAKETKSV